MVHLRALALVGLVAAGPGVPISPAEEPASLPVSDGMKVTLEYTVTLPDKTVAESTVGQEPVSYVQGDEEILPGLEKALAGLKAGDTKRVTLAAEEAYGVYDDSKKVSVPKERMPADIEVGTRLRAQDGREAKVAAIQGDTVIVDMNHPLAGKALTFDVHILKVEKNPDEPAGKPDEKEPTTEKKE